MVASSIGALVEKVIQLQLPERAERAWARCLKRYYLTTFLHFWQISEDLSHVPFSDGS